MREEGPWGKATEPVKKTAEETRREVLDGMLAYARSRARETGVEYMDELGDAAPYRRTLRVVSGDADAFGSEMEAAGREAARRYPRVREPIVSYVSGSKEVVILV